jgi:hypothetical protein
MGGDEDVDVLLGCAGRAGERESGCGQPVQGTSVIRCCRSNRHAHVHSLVSPKTQEMRAESGIRSALYLGRFDSPAFSDAASATKKGPA